MISPFYFVVCRDPDLYQVPTLLHPKSRSKKIVKDTAAAGEGETPDLSPKTMWITTKSDTTNETGTSGPTIKDVNLEKSKNERSVCKATQVESVQVISLIKSNHKTNVNIESESDPVEIKKAKSTPTVTNKNKQNVNIKSESAPIEVKQTTLKDTNNKKSASIEAHLEPIELNKIKDSLASSDEKDIETVATEKENEAGERLIPIEIPRIISWEDLGVEPLYLNKVRIGPLTETNQWSEKRAPDEKPENSFQETEVVEVAEHLSGINGEIGEKVGNS